MQRKTAAAQYCCETGWARIEFATQSKISFDGDRTSLNALYTDDSIAEINRLLSKKAAYLNPEGGFRTSVAIHTVELALHNLTGRTPVED